MTSLAIPTIRQLARLFLANVLPTAAAIGLTMFGVALANSTSRLVGRAKATPAITGTAAGKFAFNVKNVAAGDRGRGGTTVTNQTKGRTVKVYMRQGPIRGALANYLMLSVHDDSTNRCYWPTRAKGACRSLGPWKVSASFARTPVAPKRGKVWTPKEKHTFTITWQLRQTAPNAAQRQSSDFLLDWSGK